jgi:nitrate reductase NapAB chaperone NapD
MVLDRRRFLTGGWPTGRRTQELDRNAASCGILVQAQPARLDEAVAAIMALGQIDLVERDAKGKLTLAVAAANEAGLALALNTVSQVPGVLSATLTAAAPSRDEARL